MTQFDRFVSDYSGKNVLIFGLGKLGSNIGTTQLFSEIGCSLRVTDLKSASALKSSLDQLATISAEFILGQHRQEDIDWADIIVRSAAIPWHHPLLEYGRVQKKPIVMDSQLLMSYLPAQAKTIGITGTRGKTTTTLLIHDILKANSPHPVFLGGNIRNLSTLPLIKKIPESSPSFIVLELSSWQLQGCDVYKLSPHISVITNYYKDHLNVYNTYSDYISDKQVIGKYQTPKDYLILNHTQNHLHKKWLTQVKSHIIWFDPKKIPFTFNWPLLGTHNLENAAAAYEVLTLAGVSPFQIRLGFEQFAPPEFRLQTIFDQDFIIINDSNSTTPTATIKALKSITKPIILILGGEDKKLPVGTLASLINKIKPKVFLLKGSGTNRIRPLISQELIQAEFDNFERAVKSALESTASNEVLLFSPGFTSFGMFDNEYHRGDTFNQIIAQLSNPHEKKTAL